MNLWKLSWSYLRTQRLNTLLNTLLLALGIGTITLLLLFSHQLEERLSRDAAGIDLVVGAKGSPLQLILSSIYHLDVPTGNIPLQEAMMLARNPAIRQSIPLALGDSLHGYRIVGTSHAYPAHYGAEPAAGRLWKRPLEATLGAEVAARTRLKVGDHFAGAHGLGSGGHEHEATPYRVVGILAPTGSVLDRLVLTGVDSVWAVHEHHDEDEHGAEDTHPDEHGHKEEARSPQERESPQNEPGERELTAVLIQYRSPLAAATLPRQINSQSNLQAAAPAYETARLFKLLGVGLDTLRAFGWLLVLTAGLGVFVALYNTLKDRRYDLAVMRTLGATRGRLMLHILLEGLILALLGTVTGLLLGHGAAELLGQQLSQARQLELTGLLWLTEELWLIALALCVGLAAALLPAIQAYRTDIARTLAKG